MKLRKMNSIHGLKTLAVALSIAVAGCAVQNSSRAASEINIQNQSQVVQVNGTNISFREYGSGAPLILLQRFRGGMNDWDPALISALSHNNRVIIFDSVGVGESEGEIPETLEGSADFVVELLNALNIKRANIMGWSLGGMTAQVLAIKYPDRVERVILAGTTPPAGANDVELAPEEWTAIATKPKNSPEDMVYLFYTETEAGKKAANESRLRFEKLDKRGVETKTSPAIILKQAVGARHYISNTDGWFARLSDIDRPVLIANGDSDLAFPVINSKVLHREIPDSELVIYPDAGHAFLFQHANQFANDVNAFLNE